MGSIYTITCKSGIYVGGTTQRKVSFRWCTHKRSLELGKHQNKFLQNSYDKYGKDSIEFSVWEDDVESDAVWALEKACMEWFRENGFTLLNLNPWPRGMTQNDEMRRQSSLNAARMNDIAAEEHAAKAAYARSFRTREEMVATARKMHAKHAPDYYKKHGEIVKAMWANMDPLVKLRRLEKMRAAKKSFSRTE